MTPPLDLESLRRQYPEMPGWGERVFIEIHSLRAAIESRSAWTPKDVVYIASIFAASLGALKGGGVV